MTPAEFKWARYLQQVRVKATIDAIGLGKIARSKLKYGPVNNSMSSSDGTKKECDQACFRSDQITRF